uniref:Uncharacterized protein n=1 Tax=Meleagris gallopavo TaxID=9103 RepID=A0A803YSH3_MELGA
MAKGLQGCCWTMLLLLCAIQELGAWAVHTAAEGPDLGQPGDPTLLASGRVKRGWVWNQFFVVEEYTGTEPLYVGKVRQPCVSLGMAEPVQNGVCCSMAEPGVSKMGFLAGGQVEFQP